MFERVLLPAPFSPRSACTSPSAAPKSTRSFATTAGNRFVIPRHAIAEIVRRAGGGAVAPPPETSPTGSIGPSIDPLTLRASDHAFHEPAHRVEVLDRQLLVL